MTLTASTGLVVLLGDRVRHSVSPALHNAGFAALGLDLAYLACAVPADRFADALAGLHALGARGANVTVPHKEAAFELAETLGPTARATAPSTPSSGPRPGGAGTTRTSTALPHRSAPSGRRSPASAPWCWGRAAPRAPPRAH